MKERYSTCFKHPVRRLSFKGTSQEKRTSLLNPRIRFLYPPPPQSSLNYVHLRLPSHLKLCTRKYVLPLPSSLPLYLPHHCHEKKKLASPKCARKKEEVIVINHHHKHRAFGSPSPISCRSFLCRKAPQILPHRKQNKSRSKPHRRTECKPSARRRKWKRLQ